jgi:sugar/nucleoside kinase (ribokinase family)
MDDSETRRHTDLPTGIEQCFPLGLKLEIKEMVFTTGGGGTNVAVTFGRQGFKTACVGVVGDDMIGEEILAELKKENVEPIFQQHGDGFTAYSVILVNPNAERTILSYKGEGQHFDVNEVPFDKFKTKWFYIDSLGGHYDLFEALVNHAVKNGIKIACNPGGKELAHGLEKLKPLLKEFDIYLTNKEEGAELLGLNSQEVELKQVAKDLKNYVKGVVVVTDGPRGLAAADGDKFYSASVPDSPVVERTGAGDAFGSGFVAEYIRKLEAGSREPEAVMTAIQFGTANASSVVTKYGAKAGILKKGDYGPWELVRVEERGS